MRKCRRWAIGLIAIAMSTGYGNSARAQQIEQLDRTDLTVVTSHRLVFDYSRHYALFEGDVTVVDPNMNLWSDTLIIKFDENNDVESIVARGDVVIEQEDMRAESGVAAYDVPSGKIVLEEQPRVRRGQDMLTGDVITFWRDENRMICEPNARLIIFPSSDGPRTQLVGD